jgi:uncharacterized protein
MKKLLLTLIIFYQKTLSPDTGIFSIKHPNGFCRFYPHCSEYSYQAINKYGVIRGILLTIKRLIRCHPFNKGGYDPIK